MLITWCRFVCDSLLQVVFCFFCSKNELHQSISLRIFRFFGVIGIVLLACLVLLSKQNPYPGYLALLSTLAALLFLIQIYEIPQYIVNKIFFLSLFQYVGNILIHFTFGIGPSDNLLIVGLLIVM